MAQRDTTMSVNTDDTEAASVDESLAHATYRYFARLAREAGADEVARIFEASADRDATPATELAAEGDAMAPTAGDPPAPQAKLPARSAYGEQPAVGLRRTLPLAARRIAAFGRAEERHAAYFRTAWIPASA